MVKIACGVFIGVTAVLMVLRIPDWINKRREADAFDKIYNLTPDKLLSRCGKPVKDVSEATSPGDADSTIFRSMFYKREDGEITLVTFMSFTQKDKQRGWNLLSVKGVVSKGDTAGYAEYKTDSDRVSALHCMSGN